MRKQVLSALIIFAMVFSLTGCGKDSTPKIGVSFGVGAAMRWEYEKQYMEECAADLGVDIEVRLNKTDEPKTQEEDCIEMIDSGIDVLILTPRDVTKVEKIMDYAKSKNVPVISYSRVVLGEKVDLLVGYDSNRIGQKMGQYLAEMVYEGDYIILRGDDGDDNAALLYQGAMRYIDKIKEDINIIEDKAVESWEPEIAKQIVVDAVKRNGGSVDAILAPNDKIAGAAAEALAELGITEQVVITGMDAEIKALKRIIDGTQACTFYMDLKQLAYTAVEQAVHMANGDKVEVNAEYDNQSADPIQANLITGQLVTRDNLDKVLIDQGVFSKEEIYGDISK